MPARTRGFTIVELIITVVVIAILTTITVISYNGVQDRAYNASQLVDMRNTIAALEAYVIKNGRLPVVSRIGSNEGYCVGTGYPSGYCRDSQVVGSNRYPETDLQLTNAIKTIAEVPTKKRELVYGTSGPYVHTFAATHFRVMGVFKAESCPAGYGSGWNDPSSSRILCFKDVTP